VTQPTAAGVDRPSAECIRNVQLSCQLLQRHEDAFADMFFQRVLEDVRWARELGEARARLLSDGLARSALWAGLSQDSDDLVGAAMREVGANYRRQGVPDGWYQEFGKSFLYAVRMTHPGEWGSLLSSDWVAYYLWLSEFIRAGARETSPEVSQSVDAEVRIESLGDVVETLRSRYFPDNERALGAICTRVALRTGIDLRNPAADQEADPGAISNVLSTLLVLGYSLQSFSIEDAAQAPSVDADDASAAAQAAGSGSVAGRSRVLRRQISRIFGLGRSAINRGER